jgi:hypothetical protein
MDSAAMGKLGGAARAANLSTEELKEQARNAAHQKWRLFYLEHPEKAKAKRRRRKKAA